MRRNEIIVLEFLANTYTLTTTTTKTNYIAILNDAITQNSANQNDGPVPLVGAVTMYPELTQIVRSRCFIKTRRACLFYFLIKILSLIYFIRLHNRLNHLIYLISPSILLSYNFGIEKLIKIKTKDTCFSSF